MRVIQKVTKYRPNNLLASLRSIPGLAGMGMETRIQERVEGGCKQCGKQRKASL